MRFFFLVFLLLVLTTACGGGEAASGVSSPSEGDSSALGVAVPTAFPTATPWPTFTPVPTPTVTPVPLPTVAPAPTSTPWPRHPHGPPGVRLGVHEGHGEEQRLSHEDMGVYLVRQTLVPMWDEKLPDYLADNDWDRMPEPQGVFSADTPFMLWVVVFDFNEAPEDYHVHGNVRWWSLVPGEEPLLMFETESKTLGRAPAPGEGFQATPFFYEGLGSTSGSVWTPGLYRVDFVDDRGDVLAVSSFEVRS